MTVKAKQALPLLRLVHKQYYTYLESLEKNSESDILDPVFWQSQFKGDFETALDDLMKFIRSKTDKQAVSAISGPSIPICRVRRETMCRFSLPPTMP